MSKAADDARGMAEKYRTLAETSNAEGHHRFSRMADWWLNRAAEIDAAETARTLGLSS
jgi:hypothetical protein